jgi:hypothetical protein
MTSRLSRKVAAVVEAGSWEGSAASAFAVAWNADSRAGAQLAQAWNQIGTIAGNLAANLATLENALEQAADEVEKQGVYINPADGEPVAGADANGAGCPDARVLASRVKLANEYTKYRASILSEASVAKADAALALGTIAQEILPSQADWGMSRTAWTRCAACGQSPLRTGSSWRKSSATRPRRRIPRKMPRSKS